MSPFALQAVRSLMLSTGQRLQAAAVITARPAYVRITIQTTMARSYLIRTVTTSKPSAMSRSDLLSHFADVAVKLTDRGSNVKFSATQLISAGFCQRLKYRGLILYEG